MSQKKKYFPNSHAFIVGLNDYQHVASLKTPINDATQLAKVLKEKHHYENIHLLTNATKIQLEAFLTETIPHEVQKGDKVIFYFAGHGIAVDADENKEGEPKGYLVPVDADANDESSFVAMDLLNEQLHQLPSLHLLLILDCCFSGSFEWSANKSRALKSRVPKKIYKERFDRYIKDPAWQAITSAAQDQLALDVLSKKPVGYRGDDNQDHSPFALSLFEALDGAADVVPKDAIDGVITASELYIYMRDWVEKQSIKEAEKSRQTPKFFPLAKHDKGEFIFFHPTHPLNLEPIPQRNPYKGLQSFDEADEELFYGRDDTIEALQKKAETHTFIVVTGASGTGKSSVIKAGLLPKLREQGFRILPVFRPTQHPLNSLKEALAKAHIIEADTTINETNLPQLIDKLLAKPTVILIDQYEELITQCKSNQERTIFIDWIRSLLEHKNTQNVRVIITVRADFEPQFEKLGLEAYWNKARFTVAPFSQDELREVIEKPAIQEVLFFEPPELIDDIINEVIQASGALPLLSFLLSELYEKCYQKGRKLTQEAYNELGGVVGSLRTSADAIYASLDDNHRTAMRHVMIRLVSLEGGELASRRVLMPELEYSSAEVNTWVNAVIDQLLEARLLVKGLDSLGQVYVEPAHDALVRAWGTLWDWIKQFGEDNITLQRRLYEAVEELDE